MQVLWFPTLYENLGTTKTRVLLTGGNGQRIRHAGSGQQETSTAFIRRLAKALGVTADGLMGMYEEDDQGDSAPAGVALGGASAPAGRPGALRRARRGG